MRSAQTVVYNKTHTVDDNTMVFTLVHSLSVAPSLRCCSIFELRLGWSRPIKAAPLCGHFITFANSNPPRPSRFQTSGSNLIRRYILTKESKYKFTKTHQRSNYEPRKWFLIMATLTEFVSQLVNDVALAGSRGMCHKICEFALRILEPVSCIEV